MALSTKKAFVASICGC